MFCCRFNCNALVAVKDNCVVYVPQRVYVLKFNATNNKSVCSLIREARTCEIAAPHGHCLACCSSPQPVVAGSASDYSAPTHKDLSLNYCTHTNF